MGRSGVFAFTAVCSSDQGTPANRYKNDVAYMRGKIAEASGGQPAAKKAKQEPNESKRHAKLSEILTKILDPVLAERVKSALKLDEEEVSLDVLIIL
eukprot:COSAG05_NODE_43_length_25931_cov_49.314636_5_plen_97_part_00